MEVNDEDANKYCQILALLGMQEEGDPVERIKGLLEENEFLSFFFSAADFGPADADVRQMLCDEYMKTSGNEVPKGYES